MACPSVPAKSRANMYRGWPMYVTWSVPSARSIVPSPLALTPEPGSAWGAPVVMSGVQVRAQRLLQALLLPVSPVKVKSGFLLKLRTVPEDVELVLTVAVDGALV